MRALKPLLLLVALLVLTAPATAEVFDFTADPLSGDFYSTAVFRIYWPDDLSRVRAVYFYINPFNSDSRFIVDDPRFRALCDAAGVAVMGAQLDNLFMPSGSGNAVLRALKDFALQSGHPEVAVAPLFLDGWSWGGQFGYHFTKWRPDRVLGFITIKGGVHDISTAGEAVEVPGYMFIGEFDLPYRLTNLTHIFEAHRPLGAKWVLALQQGAGHGRVTDPYFLDPYFLGLLRRRLPLPLPEPGEPIELLTLAEPKGWLGDRQSFAVAKYGCFAGDPDLACWLPSADAAVRWQDFVSAGAGGDIVDGCDVFADSFETGDTSAWSSTLP
jgi:pimeloyl-ACP methyl ester carboxylesterase